MSVPTAQLLTVKKLGYADYGLADSNKTKSCFSPRMVQNALIVIKRWGETGKGCRILADERWKTISPS